MRLLLAAGLLAVTAAVPSAVAAGGVALSASPLRLTLEGASSTAIEIRNPGARPLLVDVSRAGFARSLRGRPRVGRPHGKVRWLRVRPRRLRLAAGAAASLRVTATPTRRATAGDHPALVLLTTRPVGARHVRVRLRVGVIVVLRVAGRIVHRLEPRALHVRRRGARRLFELRLFNAGNVTENLGADGLRLVLRRRGRTIATLRAHRRELLPHSAALVGFAYRGRKRGPVVVRVELRRPGRSRIRSRAFRVRL